MEDYQFLYKFPPRGPSSGNFEEPQRELSIQIIIIRLVCLIITQNIQEIFCVTLFV